MNKLALNKRFGIIVGILILTGISAFVCLPKRIGDTQQNKQRYNVIWLVCEDQSLFFPMYGDSVALTPNLSKLASEGIVYDNFFSTAAVCSPSRSTIITGMYQTSIGSHNMRAYNPYNKDNQPEIGIKSYSPVLPENVKCFTEYLRSNGYFCTNNEKEDYNFATPFTAWDESNKNAHWRNRPDKNSPFFSIFNFNITHESMVWKMSKDKILVDKSKIKLPLYFPNDSVILNDFAINYSNIMRLDEEVGKILKQLEEDGLMDKTIIFFYSDHGGPFPRYKRAIYDTGLRVPLVVRFPNKANAGKRDERMLSFIDLAPSVLSVAGIPIPTQLKGVPFINNTSKSHAYVFAATDRFDEVYDRRRMVRNERYKYIRNYYPEMPHALTIKYRQNMPTMVRLTALQAQGKLNDIQKRWFETPLKSEEFYDILKDPAELTNLAENPGYSHFKKQFSKELDKWIISTKDLGAINEKELINGYMPLGKQYVTDNVQFLLGNGKLKIKCGTSGSSIGWRFEGESHWNLYNSPIAVKTIGSKRIEAKAIRVGYKESEITYFQN